jgi:serine/threonine-protein kinase
VYDSAMSLPVATTRGARLGGRPPGRGEERVHLQRRLGFFGLSAGLALLFIWGVRLVAHPRPANHLILGGGLLLLGTWLFCRRESCSWSSLARLDVVITPTLGVLLSALTLSLTPRFTWDGSTHVEPLGYALAFPLVLIGSFLIVARAVVVPSHPVRTLWVSLATVVPMAVGIQVLNTSLPPGFAPPNPFLSSMAEIVWLFLGVGLAVMTSGVTYGLREEVREARQLGQYTLEEKIGGGGMGEVHRARHALLRRPVAVKLLPPEHSGGTSADRFEREAQLTALLTHPNTVELYDFGRTDDGIFYYVMELLDGIDLEELVNDEGPQPPARVVHILRQVCGSLVEAHELGLIHRDIKPANVILTRRWGRADVVKVVDFGLVKDLEAGADAGLTAENTITGTPLYLAPEAIRSAKGVGPSSDLYSLGALGYFLLAGQPVFTGESVVEVCGHHLHTAPTPPSEKLGRPVPVALEAVILRCLAKDPEDRPKSVAALMAELEELPEVPGWTQAEALARWDERAARCELPAAPPGPRAVDNRPPETVSSRSSAGGSDQGPDRS